MMTDEGRVTTQRDMSGVGCAYAEEAKAETKLAGMRKLGNSLEMKIKMHVGQGRRYTFVALWRWRMNRICHSVSCIL